jgi:hypothetical protein
LLEDAADESAVRQIVTLVVVHDCAEVGVGVANVDSGWVGAPDVGSNVAQSRWSAVARRLNYLAIGDRLAQLIGSPRVGPTQRRPAVNGKIFNSRGELIGFVLGPAIFDLKGKKLYGLKGVNMYKLSGELVGRLPAAQSTMRQLDKSTDELFPEG